MIPTKPADYELFNLGTDFYQRSGTAMGVLYDAKTKERWNWGMVETHTALQSVVLIRPATDLEVQWAWSQLTSIKKT